MDGQNEFAKSSANRVCESNNTRRSYDVIIVGAGVAGSSLAHTLGRDGRQVHLIERNLAEPNRIVGEALQPGGYLKLIELGLEDCVRGIDAQLVLGYEVYNDGKSTIISYPLENGRFDVAGRCFHNGRFVQKLREKAASLPNVELEQGSVTSLVKERGTVIGVQYKTKAGQEMVSYAPLTIVCDGSHSSLRQFLCKPKVEKLSYFAALVLENCQLPQRNHASVIIGDPPMVFYPIGSSEVRFLVDLPGEKLPSIANGDMAHYLKTLALQVPPKLHGAFISAIDKGQIRTMQTYRMPAMAYPTPGALLLGDALSMRHPITGTGMTAALYDVVLIRDLLRPLENLNDAVTVAKKVKHFYTMRKPVAFSLNMVAGVGYKVLCAGEASKDIGRAFFGYMSLGCFFSSGVALLISGLDPRALTLIFHSSLMSIYIAGWLLLSIPSLKRMLAAIRLYLDTLAFIWDVIIDGVRQEFLAANDQAYEESPPAN